MPSIRRATLDDAPLLAALNPHVQDLHVVGMPEVYRPTALAEVLDHYRAVLTGEAVVFLATGHDGAVGHLVARVMDQPGGPFKHPLRVLFVDEVVVRADRRGVGLGRALMEGFVALSHRLVLPV